MKYCLILLLLWLHIGMTHASNSIVKEVWTSKRIEISYQSALQPIVINRMHHWIVEIKTLDGLAVEHADVQVTGGMPAHNHGLPTSPKVTEYLGDGRYRVEGIRFHMNGLWEIRISVKRDGLDELVTIPLAL